AAGPVDGARRLARRRTIAGLDHAASQKAWRCRKGMPRRRSVISTLLSGAASSSGLRSAVAGTKPAVGRAPAQLKKRALFLGFEQAQRGSMFSLPSARTSLTIVAVAEISRCPAEKSLGQT